MSLYGIETEDDCRARIDELLEMQRLAKAAMANKNTFISGQRFKDWL